MPLRRGSLGVLRCGETDLRGWGVFAMMFCSDVFEAGEIPGPGSGSESTSIISVSGSSGYGMANMDSGRFPRAFLRWLGASRIGVGDSDGLFSLLALTGSSFSLSPRLSSSDIDCRASLASCAAWGRWVFGLVLRAVFFGVPRCMRCCLRGRWYCISSSFVLENELESSPLDLASWTAVRRSRGIGAWIDVINLAWWAKPS